MEKVDETCYPIRLYHFERAIQALESSQDKQRREMEEALILTTPTPGASFGLYATEDGTGGIITVECSSRPIIPGERLVAITGNSTSMIVGQSVVPDESVLQSAQNAVEAVRSWLWTACNLDLNRLHVHFQVRSLLEGAPGQGVSGPSAGLAMVLALFSELSGVPISPSIVATGTIGVKHDVGPVGGLGGYGTQTGKIVGILKSRRIRVTDLVLPTANFEAARDEMRILREEAVSVHPIRNVAECLEIVFGASEQALIGEIKERYETAAKLTQRA
jgi:Lon-like ATP-dependent protease